MNLSIPALIIAIAMIGCVVLHHVIGSAFVSKEEVRKEAPDSGRYFQEFHEFPKRDQVSIGPSVEWKIWISNHITVSKDPVERHFRSIYAEAKITNRDPQQSISIGQIKCGLTHESGIEVYQFARTFDPKDAPELLRPGDFRVVEFEDLLFPEEFVKMSFGKFIGSIRYAGEIK